MIARPAAPFRSANAGEFSADVRGRLDVKQYYSAGLAYKNIEPVPQSGFRQMGGTRRIGHWRKPIAVRTITSPSTSSGPHTGTQTVWTGTVAGTVAAVLVFGMAISAGTATFDVEALIDGVWTKIAGPFAIATGTAANRMAAFAPGDQEAATGIRVRATFSTSATVSFTSVTAFYEDGTAVAPRLVELTTDDGRAIIGALNDWIVDFFTEEDGYVGSSPNGTVDTSYLPDIDFYTEASTIGIFHGALETRRLVLTSTARLHDWRQDLWPYDPPPVADLGGSYTKISDQWTINLSWTSSATLVGVVATVNGESTATIWLKNGAGVVANVSAEAVNWGLFSSEMDTAIQNLPGVGPGISISAAGFVGGAFATVTFGGDLAGEEYEFNAAVTNTASAAALATHSQRGRTLFEDLFSSTRGWPGTVELVQDRLAHARIPAASGAIAMSRVGEYFDLNVEATTDNGARLDRLRSQTNETVVALKQGAYLLVFTDRGVYFVTNRTIERNQPLNLVLASETGAQPNCKPFDLEGEIYYIAITPGGLPDRHSGGGRLLSVTESVATSQTSFEADVKSLLASHLVDGVIRTGRQRPQTDLDASKGWLMRADGRLVAAQIIKNQEITGFCEWIAAAQGQVRDIRIDGHNRLWLAVERAGMRTIEVYDTAVFLQDMVPAETDLAGAVTGLPYEDGAVLWAVADGHVLGPFTCAGGAIDLEDPYDDVLVGRWQAPLWESMPQVYVTPDDDVVFRPGRIHTAQLNIVDTTSVAIGANGLAPTDVTLNRAGDPVDAPMPGRTELLTVPGLEGFVEGPTLVVTQARPGRLRVRDLAIGAKL